MTIFGFDWTQDFGIFHTYAVLFDIVSLSEVLVWTCVDLNRYAEVLLVYDLKTNGLCWCGNVVTYLLGGSLFHYGRMVPLDVDGQGWSLDVGLDFVTTIVAASRGVDLL